MDQDQIMTRDILLKECFIIGLYCIIQCAAFFCDKIIFDTFEFYFFIRYCFKTKKVYEHNKILPYKIRFMLHLICTIYFEFIQMITVWFCWFPFSMSIFFSWIAIPNVEIPIMFVWDDYFYTYSVTVLDVSVWFG